MSDTLLATSVGVLSPGASAATNTATLLAAIAAAANDQSKLILPGGSLQFDQDLVLPSGFQGDIAIEGAGTNLTKLVAVGGCNGFNFDLSAGNPSRNSVDLSNVGLFASAQAGFAWKFSWGASGIPSLSDYALCRLSGVYVGGGGWTNGGILVETWNALLQDLFFYGNMTSYGKGSALGKGDGGPGSGIMLSLVGGVNNLLQGIRGAFFSQGVTFSSQRGAPGDGQGWTIRGLRMVECIEGIHAYGTPGGYFGSVVVDDLMVDNGNLLVANHRGVVVENANNFAIGKGQLLQKGGDSQVIFDSCTRCKIDPQMSMEFRSNTTGAAVQDNNGNQNDLGPQADKLVDIATRGFVGTGSSIMIAGFVISGSVAKTVLIRASGPALAQFGVAGVLPDPLLKLFSGSTLIASNQGWGASAPIAAAAAQVGAFAWPTAGSLDSAILATLQPGSYTAQLSGDSGDTGNALLEVYDVS